MDSTPPTPSGEGDLPQGRLDDHDAMLQAQEQDDTMDNDMSTGKNETEEAAMDQAPKTKRPKRKPMKAQEQAKTLEALQSVRARFTQQQQQQQQREPPTPISPPAEILELPSAVQEMPSVAQESPAKPVKRRRSSTVDDKAHLDRRSEPPQTSKLKKLSYKEAKDIVNNIRPEIQDIINRMKELGKPFDRGLESVISFAGMVLDGQEGIDGIMLQLFQMGDEWKATHDEKRKAMIAFLERHGIIPMGSAA